MHLEEVDSNSEESIPGKLIFNFRMNIISAVEILSIRGVYKLTTI